jgi:hypothetical protein
MWVSFQAAYGILFESVMNNTIQADEQNVMATKKVLNFAYHIKCITACFKLF